MKTITFHELLNFFAECDSVRIVNGTSCSFDINYPENRVEIRWGRNYETWEHEFEEFFPFNKNQNIEISNDGVVKLICEDNTHRYFFFTKTLTLRDFQ